MRPYDWGLADTAEWVAMGLHTSLLERAAKSGRVAPRQLGCNGYEVVEFRMCADWRWHKVDAYDRALPDATAELLDEEALLAALERSTEEAAEAAAAAEQEAAEAAYAESPAGLAAAAAAEAAAAAAASTRSEVGVVGTPDDEMVDNRVRAMQSQLQVGTRNTL